MRPLRVLAAAALVLGAGACAGDEGESEADIKEELSETLQRSSEGFEDRQLADCFADIVIEQVGVEELQDLELSAEEPPAEVEEKIAEAAIRAREECGEETGSG
jgi:hypothetical protein